MRDRKFNEWVDKINYLLIIILVILVPITFFFNWFCLYKLRVNVTFKVHQYLSIILPIEIAIYIYKIITKQIKLSIFDILIYLMILFGLIATANAIEVDTSIWGSRYRFEGLVQIVTYYFLFLNSRSFITKERIIKILNSFIVMGLVQFVYSFLQVFVRGDWIYIKYDGVHYRPSGFVGHPNMLGSFVVLVLLISFGLYLLYDKNKRFYLISTIILYINLVLTESTGPFYGFCAGLLFLLIFLWKKKIIDFKKIAVIVCSAIAIFFTVSLSDEWVSENIFFEEYHPMYSIRADIVDTIDIVLDLFTVGDSDEAQLKEFGSNRGWLWSRAVKLIPKYFWTGAGIDNFGPAFLEVDDRKTAYFDKAHNEYLQLLITQGGFAFITYMGFLVLTFIRGIKSKENLSWVLLFAIVGFAVQAFSNISVYNVTPFFYITMGLLVGITDREKSGVGTA